MPKALLLLATFALTANAQAPQGKLYIDARYGYSFFLPAELTPTPGTAGELTLRSHDGATTVRFNPTSESRPGFPGHDLDTEGTASAKDCDQLPPAYVLRKPEVVAFSCARGTAIHYSIIRYTATGSVAMDGTYPATQRAHWDAVVGKIATTLKRTR